MKIVSELTRKKGIVSGSAGSLLIKTASLFLALSVSVVLAKVMGPSRYGAYVLVVATVLLLSIPLTLGLPMLLVRFISQYDSESQYGLVKGLIIRAHQLVLLIYGTLAIGSLVFYLYFADKSEIEFWHSYLWGAGLLLFVGLGAIRCAILEGFRYVVIGQVPDLILQNTFLLIFVYIAMRFQEISVSDAVFLHMLSALLSYLIGIIITKIKIGDTLKSLSSVFMTRLWLSSSLSYCLNMSVNSVKVRISTYVLAAFTNTAAVGFFEIATKAAGFVSFSLAALNKALAPHISRSYQRQDIEKVQYIIQKSSKFMFFMALPVVTIFLLFGERLLVALYGQNYAPAYFPLVIISIGHLVNTYAGAVGLFLLMANKQAFVFKVNLMNVLTNICISIILINYYGVIGAAISYALLMIIQNFIFVIYANKIFKIRTTAF